MSGNAVVVAFFLLLALFLGAVLAIAYSLRDLGDEQQGEDEPRNVTGAELQSALDDALVVVRRSKQKRRKK